MKGKKKKENCQIVGTILFALAQQEFKRQLAQVFPWAQAINII